MPAYHHLQIISKTKLHKIPDASPLKIQNLVRLLPSLTLILAPVSLNNIKHRLKKIRRPTRNTESSVSKAEKYTYEGRKSNLKGYFTSMDRNAFSPAPSIKVQNRLLKGLEESKDSSNLNRALFASPPPNIRAKRTRYKKSSKVHKLPKIHKAKPSKKTFNFL